MNGPEFIARAVATGSVFDFSVGAKLAAVDKKITLDYIEEFQGRRGKRSLRRDYGLFEVTFIGEPEWVCQSVVLEIHRLSSMPDLADKVKGLTGIDLAPYTAWSDVEDELQRLGGSQPFDPPSVTQEYRTYRSKTTGVSVHVIGDPASARGVYPGHGDIWSLDIVDPKFL
ncbi:hypothetical protein [Streptomyces sp. WM6378]|uniref:hypothetical protein n=1 Tax=Streptomyces sp. WM6378 TaxID=1415557 RepID=UPI000A4A4A08|nr:hypothetical protein [Streptomyces sp. WM6378]